MILRSIQVDNWRCFIDPVRVGPLGDGLNVVHGPNGSGKSTLLWALARGLFDSYKVTGADIESLRPWGRQLKPRVEIEFEHNQLEFRLVKQFLDTPAAELWRRENGKYVRFAEAAKADEFVRDLLAAEPPGRGPSKLQHWGFAQVLWATQGALQIDQLSDGTRNTIHDSLGSQLAGPGGEELEGRIAKLYDTIFTPTGKLKGGASAPPVVSLTKELDRTQHRRAELAEKLTQFEEASRRIEDLRLEGKQLEQEASGFETRSQEAQATAKKYDDLISHCKLLEEKEKNARNAYETLDQRIKAIKELRSKAGEVAGQLADLNDRAVTVAEHFEQCKQEAQAAAKALAELRGRRSAIDDAENLARRARQYVDAIEAAGKLAERISKITEARKNCENIRQERGKVVAPDAQTLKKLQQVERKRDEARLKLDATAMKLTIEAERDLTIDIQRADATGRQEIGAKNQIDLVGAPDVEFAIEGTARIRASGPTESTAELSESWQAGCRQMEALTAGFGTQEVAELQSLAEQAGRLDADLRAAEVQLETLLDGRELGEIKAEELRLRAIMDEVSADDKQWQQSAPDAESLARLADESRKEYGREVSKAEQGKDLADQALAGAQKSHNELEAGCQSAQRQLDETKEQLRNFEDDGLDDSDRAKQRDELAMQWRGIKGELENGQQQLEALGDNPHEIAQALRKQREALITQAHEAEKKLAGEQAKLQSIINEAPYSALAQIEEDIERLQQEIEREQLSNEAIRLLHQTFLDEKDRAFSAVIDPVRQRATRTLQRIVGGRFEEIAFDESLLPTGIRPATAQAPVALDYLSGGEQEQVHFAVRLALADVAFGGQRQLVVLDDAFTATDTSRLARIIRILEEAAQRFQIVLLSCHPERYKHLSDVQFFDLVQLAQGDGGQSE